MLVFARSSAADQHLWIIFSSATVLNLGLIETLAKLQIRPLTTVPSFRHWPNRMAVVFNTWLDPALCHYACRPAPCSWPSVPKTVFQQRSPAHYQPGLQAVLAEESQCFRG